LWRRQGLSQEIENGSNACAVAKVLVNRLPNLARFRGAIDRNPYELTIVIGDQAG
jgi:hypothetical protein